MRTGLGVVSLLLYCTLIGCGSPQRLSGIIVAQGDVTSTDWSEGKASPWARTWSNGTMNLWVTGRGPYGCSARSRYAAAYRGTKFGNVWSGTVCDSYADSLTQVTGGSFTLTEDDSTLAGWSVLRVTGPCGSRSDTLSLLLARVN